MPRLIDRLQAQAAQRFVGRDAELAVLREALSSQPPRWPVLLVHGPGGVGKTTLLERMRQLAAEAGVDSLRLDGRDIVPSPDGVLHTLGIALGLEPAATTLGAVLAQLESRPRRLLTIDTFEELQAIEAWLRTTLLPALPDGLIVVLAGRAAPQREWRTDPLWQGSARVLALRNLGEQECAGYLQGAGIAAQWHAQLTELSHGHPLALSLLADVCRSTDSVPERLHVDLIRDLADRFCALAPSPLHRRALQLCAQERRTTQPLLAAVLGEDCAPDLFDWLAELNFVEFSGTGLFPHDLVREALQVELAVRDPQSAIDLRKAARAHILTEMLAAPPEQVWPHVCNLWYQNRHGSMGPYTDYRAIGSVWFRPATAADDCAIKNLLCTELPPAQHCQALAWAAHPAAVVWVAGRWAEPVSGVSLTLDLSRISDEEAAGDPLIHRLAEVCRSRQALRPGWRRMVNRYNVYPGSQLAGWQLIEGGVRNALHMIQFYLWVITQNAQEWAICIRNPAYFRQMMEDADFQYQPATELPLDGVTYGAFLNDWKGMAFNDWMLYMDDLVVRRELAGLRAVLDRQAADGTSAMPQDRRASVQALSKAAFEQAVKLALRQLADPLAQRQLADNPLSASTLVRRACLSGEKPAAALCRLLHDTAASLAGRPRDAKFWRALELTYFRPAGSQELAAERLGLLFSTYRYQLTTGIDKLVELLWAQETAAED